MAETLVKPYNMSIANRLMGPLAQTNHFLVTISSLTPEVEGYLQSISIPVGLIQGSSIWQHE